MGTTDMGLGMKSARGLFGLTLSGALALAPLHAGAADLSMGGGGYKDVGSPAWIWNGFYAGANVGGGWGGQVLANSETSFPGVNPGGWFGGGQIGYNWQGRFGFPNIVLGVEADIQGGDVGDSLRDVDGSRYKSELDYFGTVRGRIGYAADRSLYYLTAGFAYGGVRNQAVTGSPAVNYNIDTTATGYALGGGIEMMVARAWSIKAEFQYFDLGSNDPVSASGTHYRSGDDAFDTVRVGLNYHLGAGYLPLK
jgi:outer membrane immunogenic protein